MKNDGRLYGALLHLSYNMWCDRRGLRDLNEKRRYPIPDDITGEWRPCAEFCRSFHMWCGGYGIIPA